MGALRDYLDDTDGTGRASVYQRLAESAMTAYPLTVSSIALVGHNSAVAYCVDCYEDGLHLLKVHEPNAHDQAPPSAVIESGLEWLEYLGQHLDAPTQRPVRNKDGGLVTQTIWRDPDQAVACTVQRWITGQHPDDFTDEQAHQVGSLMASMHAAGAEWRPGHSLACEWTSDSLWTAAAAFSTSNEKPLEPQTLDTIESAVASIVEISDQLRKRTGAVGPIHSDIHQENVLVTQSQQVTFIDFAKFEIAPFAYDLGVTLYHCMYQDPSIRQNLIEGYREVIDLEYLPPMALEAFICSAALRNLAFQITIPEQRVSVLFHKNVADFAKGYCRQLIAEKPFALD